MLRGLRLHGAPLRPAAHSLAAGEELFGGPHSCSVGGAGAA